MNKDSGYSKQLDNLQKMNDEIAKLKLQQETSKSNFEQFKRQKNSDQQRNDTILRQAMRPSVTPHSDNDSSDGNKTKHQLQSVKKSDSRLDLL